MARTGAPVAAAFTGARPRRRSKRRGFRDNAAMSRVETVACPCQSGRAYAQCCAPLHRGEAIAETAEALMRSRYSAYVRGDAEYLLATWHASTRPATRDFGDATATRWLGLDV